MVQVLERKVSTQSGVYECFDVLRSSVPKDVLDSMCTKSDTLHYLGCLQLPSQRVDRVVQGQVVVAFKSVGGKFVSDISIKVPRIPVNASANLDQILKALTYEEVKAGEVFDLTYLEYMFLILEPGYSGFCLDSNVGQEMAVCFRTAKFLKNNQDLPTPTFRFMHGGSVKDRVFDIEYFDGDYKSWILYPEYEEKFLPYVERGKKKKRYFTLGTGVENTRTDEGHINFLDFLKDKGCEVDDEKPSNSKEIVQHEVSFDTQSKTVNNVLFVARYIYEKCGLDLGWHFNA